MGNTSANDQPDASQHALSDRLKTLTGVRVTRPAADHSGPLEVHSEPGSGPAARRALVEAGYRPSPIQADGPSLFVTYRNGRWEQVRLDDGNRSERPSRRRRGLVVAVVGPDGSGKGTVIARLTEGDAPLAFESLYFGSGTSSGGPGNSSGVKQARPAGPFREAAFVLRKAIRAARRLAQAYQAARRGRIVLCDRHPIETLAIRPRRRYRFVEAIERRAFGAMPSPDAVVVLDAPADVLFGRKPEHPVDRLEGWRRAFRLELDGEHTTIISTDQPPEATEREVCTAIWTALARQGSR